MNDLNARDLQHEMRWKPVKAKMENTICRAAMHTVFIENLRPHISKRSSRLGPRRSITRMLCSPSWPKWYIWGIPADATYKADMGAWNIKVKLTTAC